VLEDHPDGPLPDFGGKLLRCALGCAQTPIVSRNGVSGNPGAVNPLEIEQSHKRKWAHPRMRPKILPNHIEGEL
jgi:hypothetical protein